MIEELPAPREAPNAFTRALGLLFGTGWVLIGVAALVLLPWYFVRLALSQWEATHSSALVGFTWTAIIWGIATRFAVKLFAALSVVLVGLGARQLLRDQSLDLQANFAVMGARWRPLLGVLLLWTLVSECANLVTYYPLSWVWARTPEVYANAFGVIASLIAIGTSWSLLTAAFGRGAAVRAFLSGLTDPWTLRMRSALILTVFIAAHFAQRWISQNIGFALSHFSIPYLATAGRGLVEAVFVTFLTTLLTFAYLEQ